MVFTTGVLWRRILFSKPTPGPDRYWKKRKVLKMAANIPLLQHFYGRRQNCYKIAFSAVRRALRHSTLSRDLKKKDFRELHIARITAACEEHGLEYKHFKESLIRSNVLLNSKMLAELAVWEPRTFKCLTEFAWKKASEEGLNGINELGNPPSGVILKPMIIK